MSALQPQARTMLNAVTTTTTSGPLAVNDAGRLSIMVLATAVSSGNGVYTVEISNDGSNWSAYNRLTTNATNTNAQTDARVASITLSTNTTNFLFFPPGDTFAFFRTKVTVTTDGSYSAIAYVD